MKTKVERIELAIKKNREMILKGGDRVYYTKQILKLNEIIKNIENGKL